MLIPYILTENIFFLWNALFFGSFTLIFPILEFCLKVIRWLLDRRGLRTIALRVRSWVGRFEIIQIFFSNKSVLFCAQRAFTIVCVYYIHRNVTKKKKIGGRRKRTLYDVCVIFFILAYLLLLFFFPLQRYTRLGRVRFSNRVLVIARHETKAPRKAAAAPAREPSKRQIDKI